MEGSTLDKNENGRWAFEAGTILPRSRHSSGGAAPVLVRDCIRTSGSWRSNPLALQWTIIARFSYFLHNSTIHMYTWLNGPEGFCYRYVHASHPDFHKYMVITRQG